jgi:hypothetical protein
MVFMSERRLIPPDQRTVPRTGAEVEPEPGDLTAVRVETAVVCQDPAAEFVKVPVPALRATLSLFRLVSRALWPVEALKA